MIELAPPQVYYAMGMRTGVIVANPPVLFPQVLLRRNVIRATDGLPDPPSGYTRIGLQVLSGGGVIVEENVVDASDPHPISFEACSSTGYFANQTPGGALIQARDLAAKANLNELANVEDTVLLAI